MKKLSLILVAMATLVMVGCKPLTGSTVCTDHIEGEGVLTKEPACGVEGEKTFYCKVCDTKLRTEVVPASDHIEGEGWYTNSKVKGTEYGVDNTGAYYLDTKAETDSCYGEQCPNCKRFNHKKTYAFFNSDTTIGVATDVSRTAKGKCTLSLDTWTVEKFNSYYENRNTYSNKCNCGDECVGKCGGNCVDKDCNCGELTCIRRVPTDRNTNILYFGDDYIEY